MKLVSYVELPIASESPAIKLGAKLGDQFIVDLAVAQSWAQGARGFGGRKMPRSMLELLNQWEIYGRHFASLLALLPMDHLLELKGAGRQQVASRRADVLLLAPLPNPLTLRLFDVFEEHVRNRYRLRSRATPDVWFEAPAFNYGNPLTVVGPERALPAPRFGQALDFGIQIACVLGRQISDATPDAAEEAIAGYMMLNNWSVHDAPGVDAGIGFGSARAGDFATTLGEALVTTEELEDRAIGSSGEVRYDLEVTVCINGDEAARANVKEMNWTFGQMIAHASEGMTLYPGEIFASGVVPCGSLVECGSEETGDWLLPGDTVDLKIERLGRLETHIIPTE